MDTDGVSHTIIYSIVSPPLSLGRRTLVCTTCTSTQRHVVSMGSIFVDMCIYILYPAGKMQTPHVSARSVNHVYTSTYLSTIVYITVHPVLCYHAIR